MLEFKVNINEIHKIKLDKNSIRKDFYLTKGDSLKQTFVTKKPNLNIILSDGFNVGDGFIITNDNSSIYNLNVIKSDGTTLIRDLEPNQVFNVMLTGSTGGEWVESSEFIDSFQLPLFLTENFDANLGYGQYIEEVVGERVLTELVPTMVDMEKIKFKPVYNDIKIMLWFCVYDQFGVFSHYTNLFGDTTPFLVNSNYFNTSYLQVNYYTDNDIQGNNLIDYKQYSFDERVVVNTMMLVNKPYSTDLNTNIQNYYFYYFESLFTDYGLDEITLYIKYEFKNTKTGKNMLFTTNNSGLVVDSNGVIDKTKLYNTMTLKLNGGDNPMYVVDNVGIGNTLNLYQVRNK